MKRIFFIFLFLLIQSHLIFAGTKPDRSRVSVIPKPVSLNIKPGKFIINNQTVILVSPGNIEMQRIAHYFTDRLHMAGGPDLVIREMKKEDRNIRGIIFKAAKGKNNLDAESYELHVSPNQIQIIACKGAGWFYGVQSLLQVLPPEICQTGSLIPQKTWDVSCMIVRDHPRFPYRGMHLDVSRHFFPKEFIKRYIDLLSMYKMNRFHWHLTDDNGWRIEIKKYPKLMETGAWHVDHEDLPWDKRPPQQPGEKATYGGYYSQDEVREIVQYAAERYITIIPEIEMPAHSAEVVASYPQFSCTGRPFTVPTGSYWPDIDILCAGNDSVYTFMEDVLTEVMALFPSHYIHIGGDEADKTNWKKCPKCQARIRNEGLKDETGLQSYFIKRIEKFIVSKNRQMIGWDEILEGGLAPQAIVMSWRGIDGGIAAVKQGHDAIMTPGSYCYFDHYQADPATEPKAIGGFTTLKKVYSYEPVPEELDARQAKHILGAQGNVWTEFIPTPAQAEYMAVPRMIALSEVVWSPANQRNWNDFHHRLTDQFTRLNYMHVNYCKGSFRAGVSTHYDKKTNSVRLYLESEQPGIPIHYTLDGNDVKSSSPVYKSPVELKNNGMIKAAIFLDGKMMEKETEIPFIYHHAIGKPVKYISSYSSRYPSSGKEALTDGLRGSTDHHDDLWQGFLEKNLELVIDIGEVIPINSIQVNFLQNQKNWIFLPLEVEYSLSSDGKKYHSFNEVLNTVSPKESKVILQPFNFQFMADTKARYIRVKAKNMRKCPSWHEGSGQPCWIFLDEIVVY